MFTFTVRYRDGLGRWSVGFIRADTSDAASQIANARFPDPVAVTRYTPAMGWDLQARTF